MYILLQLEQQRKAERERLRAEKEGVESLLIAPAQGLSSSDADADVENRIVIQSMMFKIGTHDIILIE
jgi:hypothetical protein